MIIAVVKFLYEYRNSNNEKCRGAIFVASRDDVYKELRKKGIKATRVELAPGFLNKILSYGWLILVALGLVLVFLAGIGISMYMQEPDVDSGRHSKMVFDSMTRRQVIGDAVVIEKESRTGWASVFNCEGERFLASFAMPGVSAGVKSTNENELRDALGRCISVEEGDAIEVRQIKSIVEGLKSEMREFLAAGGTIKEYGARLVSRQEQEISIYNRVREELQAFEMNGSAEEYLSLWERRNRELHRMGIKQIPVSDRAWGQLK